MNFMDAGNEVFVYMFSLMLVYFAGTIMDVEQSRALGWFTVALHFIYAFFNTSVIMHELIVFAKLLWTRYYKNRRKNW